LGDKSLDSNSEIIVVDNGSRDGSAKLAESYKVKKTKNLTLKLIQNKQNLGFAKGVNQGIRQVEGKIIFLLNSDTVVKKGALGALLDFEKKFRPVIVGAKLLNSDGTVQPSVFHLPTIGRAISEYWLGKKGSFSKYSPVEEKPVEVEAVVGGAMLISKEVIEKVGLFDERYFMYFEDLDYCRRARKIGFKIYYLPSARIVHQHGASGRNISTRTNRWLVESSKIYHGPAKHNLITLILRLGQKWQKILKR
jgi:GT2 family glycosyltransferase